MAIRSLVARPGPTRSRAAAAALAALAAGRTLLPDHPAWSLLLTGAELALLRAVVAAGRCPNPRHRPRGPAA